MKYIDSYIKTLLAAAVAVFAAGSCISLDEDITAQPTADKFFNEADDFYSLIASAYSSLVTFYGSDVPYCMGAPAEDVTFTVERWEGFKLADINSVGNPDELTDMAWDCNYKAIGICNTVLQTIEDCGMDRSMLAEVEGEAKFLRAFSYFNLVRYFRTCPVITEDNAAEAATATDDSTEEVYALILTDLQDAERMLPDEQQDAFRPTLWAAKALYADVYLTMAGYPLYQTDKYALARDKANEIIVTEKFDLEDVYFDLWLWDNRYTNKEFIFTFYANADNGDQTYVNCGIRPTDGGESGWGDWTSDKRFLEEFPAGNYANKEDNPRVKGTFYLTLRDGTRWEDSIAGEPYVGKLRDAGEHSGGYEGPWNYPNGNADGFFNQYRLSEILLIYAEAANQADNGPSEAAYDALNRVRERAGCEAVENLSKEEFDKAVLDERKWELAFENSRWFDICRRQLLQEVMDKYEPGREIDDHNYWMPKPYDKLDIWTGVEQNAGY